MPRTSNQKPVASFSQLKGDAVLLAQSFADGARERVEGVRTAMGDRIDDVGARAADATESVGKRAGDAVTSGSATLADMFKRHPVASAAAVLGIAYLAMKLVRR